MKKYLGKAKPKPDTFLTCAQNSSSFNFYTWKNKLIYRLKIKLSLVCLTFSYISIRHLVQQEISLQSLFSFHTLLILKRILNNLSLLRSEIKESFRIMLFVLITCVCSYQVTYQLCHQISVNFPPLTAYWSSPITKNYFLTKQIFGRFVIASSIPYLESLYFLGSTKHLG